MGISKEQREAIEFENAIMRRCPQRNTCGALECPLDPLHLKRWSPLPGEEECRAQKPTRLGIVAQATADGIPAVHALKHGGLTEKEWQREQKSLRAKERHASLSPEERAVVEERLAKGREKRRRQLGDEETPTCVSVAHTPGEQEGRVECDPQTSCE